MGLTYEVKEAEKLTMRLQSLPRTELCSVEGYMSCDVCEKIREGKNPTIQVSPSSSHL